MAEAGPVRASTLDEQLCFALYAASRAMTGCYRSALEPVGLTYPQYLVMLVLWERGDTLVSALSTALQLDTGTLSPLLKRLEAGGLVTRTRQEADERMVLVALTPAGRALEAGVAAAQQQVTAAAGMSRAELAELRTTLRRLTDRLRAANPARSA